MGLLRAAIREGRRVRLGYAADDGSDSRHVVLPISMAAGVVRGHESRSPGLQAFALHRITAVGLLDEDGDDAPQ
jgi:predicted DNA-binding transcriptional regulator YafY